MKPDISFVVPVYNKQSYIAETLNTLKNQTHKNIEVIIIDDSSTDNSLHIINHFLKDKRFSCVSFGENKGRSFARNYGNNLARADIIAVNDADDLSHQERAAEILKNFKEIDVFYSGFVIANKDAETKKIMPAIEINRKKILRDGCTYIGHSTMAYHKEILRYIKYSEGAWSDLGLDDWKIQMDMIKSGLIFGFVEDPLIIYRSYDDGIVQTRDKAEVVKIKKEYLRENFK